MVEPRALLCTELAASSCLPPDYPDSHLNSVCREAISINRLLRGTGPAFSAISIPIAFAERLPASSCIRNAPAIDRTWLLNTTAPAHSRYNTNDVIPSALGVPQVDRVQQEPYRFSNNAGQLWITERLTTAGRSSCGTDTRNLAPSRETTQRQRRRGASSFTEKSARGMPA